MAQYPPFRTQVHTDHFEFFKLHNVGKTK